MIKSRESQCCGCAACAEVCPVQAIQMKTEKNGFYYPVIDSEICIKCNKCLSVCRFSNDFSFPNLINQPVRISYIARLKNIDNLLHSASGGMFTAFSDAIIQENGVIYGALFDDEFRVYHGRAEDPNERDKMRGSKYVQSNTVTIYKRILNDLKSNRKVVFFGTPCQCSAILGFLSSCSMSTDKLILVDIICHGVSSPLVWKKYLNFVKEKYINEDISNVCFRDKYYGYGYNMTIKGNTKIYHKDDILDPYIYIFTKNLAIRPSCYECPFKKSDRVSDITIGDFQKARLYFPEFDDGKGNSVVLINTKKGKQLFENIEAKLTYAQCLYEQADQPNLHGQMSKPHQYDSFFRDLQSLSFEKVLKKYTEYGMGRHLYGSLRRLIRKIVYIIEKKGKK